VAFFGALFAARTDVYAIRYDNAHTGKGGWIAAVRGRWRKGVRHEDRNYLPLTAAVLAAHLKGEAHIGLYPLLDGDSAGGWRPTSTARRRCATPSCTSRPAAPCRSPSP
jgi:hypothetical protein